MTYPSIDAGELPARLRYIADEYFAEGQPSYVALKQAAAFIEAAAAREAMLVDVLTWLNKHWGITREAENKIEQALANISPRAEAINAVVEAGDELYSAVAELRDLMRPGVLGPRVIATHNDYAKASNAYRGNAISRLEKTEISSETKEPS